jgi:hypothetical protein
LKEKKSFWVRTNQNVCYIESFFCCAWSIL